VIARAKWTGGVAQAIELLLCKCKTLSSNPSPSKKKKKKKEGRTHMVFCLDAIISLF
jgi:hypothetical protein